MVYIIHEMEWIFFSRNHWITYNKLSLFLHSFLSCMRFVWVFDLCDLYGTQDIFYTIFLSFSRESCGFFQSKTAYMVNWQVCERCGWCCCNTLLSYAISKCIIERKEEKENKKTAIQSQNSEPTDSEMANKTVLFTHSQWQLQLLLLRRCVYCSYVDIQ